MLAPIALYPDSLPAQVLLASTYPSEVVLANRWGKAHKGWSKAKINAALDRKDWDLSVKALVTQPLTQPGVCSISEGEFGFTGTTRG